MGDGRPATGVPLANQGFCPLSLAKSQPAYFARWYVLTLIDGPCKAPQLPCHIKGRAQGILIGPVNELL
jgi:hypothetical protein